MPYGDREPRERREPIIFWTLEDQQAAQDAFAGLANPTAAWAAYQAARRSGQDHAAALAAGQTAGSGGGGGFRTPTIRFEPTPAPSPAPSPITPQRPPTGLLTPFPGTFRPPPPPTGPPGWFQPAPGFNPPTFQAPTLEQALNEPGYAFAAEEGRKGLERSAAARGVLGTGGTLKDILAYGQNLAGQQYGNVFNRALDAYRENYRRAFDIYQPQYASWQAANALTQRQGELDYQNLWNQFLTSYDQWRNQNRDWWDRVISSGWGT